MATDHVADGIRVNAVAPDSAETPWVARLLAATDDPDAAAQALRSRQPRVGEVDVGHVPTWYGIHRLTTGTTQPKITHSRWYRWQSGR
jgi:NAD(P)-dependent dehydrogenase (short-subunit alcohol dehydrogenase family)